MISTDTRIKLRNIIQNNIGTLAKYISEELGSDVIRYTDNEILYKIKKSHFGKHFEHTSLYYLDTIKPAIGRFLSDSATVNELVASLKDEYNNEFMLKEMNEIVNNPDQALQLFNIKAYKGNIISISY